MEPESILEENSGAGKGSRFPRSAKMLGSSDPKTNFCSFVAVSTNQIDLIARSLRDLVTSWR